MDVVVMGAGRFGVAIAEKLSQEQHNVTVIDRDEARLARVSDSLDVLTIQGNGASAKVLEKAEIQKADMFLAVTDMDETNLIACQLARHYGISKCIARVGDLSFLPSDGGLTPEDLGVDLFINPEQLCAQEIVRLLQTQAVHESQEFVDGRIMLVALSAGVPNPLLSRTLASFQSEGVMQQVRLVAIAREGKTIIPRGSTRVEMGDDLYFMCPRERLDDMYGFLGVDSSPPSGVLIVGGGEVGTQTAQLLEEQNIKVRLLEGDQVRAEEIAGELGSTLVFKGDAGNLKELQNAGLGGVDGFVAACRDDEVNILSCLMAKQFGARKTLAVIRKSEYLPLLSSLRGVDATVSPRMITASAILKLIRRGKIRLVVAVRDIEAEVIEIEVQANSKVTGKKIRQIEFPEDAVMGCIVRGERILPAQGEEVLLENDRVVVLTRPVAVRDVENLFDRKARGLIF